VNIPQKPTPPLPIILRESDDFSKVCSVCKSSLKRNWFGFRTENCINKECPNYFDSMVTNQIKFEQKYKNYLNNFTNLLR